MCFLYLHVAFLEIHVVFLQMHVVFLFYNTAFQISNISLFNLGLEIQGTPAVLEDVDDNESPKSPTPD